MELTLEPPLEISFLSSDLYTAFKTQHPSFSRSIDDILIEKRNLSHIQFEDRPPLKKEDHTLWALYLFFSFSQSSSTPHDALKLDSDIFTQVQKLITENPTITHGQILFELVTLDAETFTSSSDEDTRRTSLSATYLREVFGVTFHLKGNEAMYLNEDACPFLQTPSCLDSKFQEAIEMDSLPRFFSDCFDPSDNCFDVMTETILKTKFFKTYTYQTCSIFDGLKSTELNKFTVEYFFDMFERHNQLLFWDFLMTKQVDFDSTVPLSELNTDLDVLITKLEANEDLCPDSGLRGSIGYDGKKLYRAIDVLQVLSPINVPLFLNKISKDKPKCTLLSFFTSSEIITILKSIKSNNNKVTASKKYATLISSLQQNGRQPASYTIGEIETKLNPTMVETFKRFPPEGKQAATALKRDKTVITDDETYSLTKEEIKQILESIENTNPNTPIFNDTVPPLENYALTSDERLTAIQDSHLFQNSGYMSKTAFIAFIKKYYPEQKDKINDALLAEMGDPIETASEDSSPISYHDFLTRLEDQFHNQQKRIVSTLKQQWAHDSNLVHTFSKKGFLSIAERNHLKRIAHKNRVDFSDELLAQIGKTRQLMSIFPGQIPVIHGHSNAQLILFKVIKAISILSERFSDQPLQKTMRPPKPKPSFTIQEVMDKVDSSHSPNYDFLTKTDAPKSLDHIPIESIKGSKILYDGKIFTIDKDEQSGETRILTLSLPDDETPHSITINNNFGIKEQKYTSGEETISVDETAVQFQKVTTTPLSTLLFSGSVDALGNCFDGFSAEGWLNYAFENTNQLNLATILPRVFEELGLEIGVQHDFIQEIQTAIEKILPSLGSIGGQRFLLFPPLIYLQHI